MKIKNMIGLYIKTDGVTKKHLIYFKELEAWAELLDEQIELVKDNFVSTENQKIAERIQELKVTCAC